MKKNYIFDLLHDRIEFIKQINLSSSFQWYGLTSLWTDIQKLVANDIQLGNLFTEPVCTRLIVEQCFPQYLDKIPDSSDPGAKYDLRTKHASLWGESVGYIQSASDVLESIRIFVCAYVNLQNFSPDRLCISNIAWSETADITVSRILSLNDVGLLELAPTKVFKSWDDVTVKKKVEEVKGILNERGLQVVSLQSVLFNKPELELFGSHACREDMLCHTKQVIELASFLGARVIVWGSPRQRQTHGKPYDECFQIALSWFKRAGEYANKHGVKIGIEANAQDYGCDFCYTTPQAAELVRAVDCPGVQLHLDTANLHMAADDIPACVEDNRDIICHVQVSEPHLGNFSAPVVDHVAMAKSLKNINYAGVISIEMREDPDDSVRAIADALHFVKKTYKEVL